MVTASSATAQPPTTSVLVPAAGAKVAGTTTLDASAPNATSVEFWILGGTYGFTGKMVGTATLTIYGWVSSWNTMTVPNATYALVSEAFNASGSSFSTGVVITVSNPTSTSVLVPATGANLSNTATLDASAGNASSVEFLLSGGSYGSAPGQVVGTGTPTLYGWLNIWNTMTVPNGSYALVSEAFNGGGSILSTPISITIDNAPHWSQFGFGPNHGGYNSNETAISDANVSSLVQVFSARAGSNSDSSPVVVNGVLYEGADDHMLYAYDAAGATGCSGSPKTCAPLWTASSGGFRFSSPAVANGVVYEGSHDGILYAYDAAGLTKCSGTPKICAPLWTANTGSGIESSATVANGDVYIGSGNGNVDAFDAAGNTNCSGTPKTCAPLWVAHTGSNILVSSAAVANGVLFVGSVDHNLYAFDAAGVTNCSGTPKICSPLWTASTGNQVWSSPAVVNGVVYIGSGDGSLYVFDAGGTTNCSGTPKKCAPLWTARTGGGIISSPAVANGVVYVGSSDNNLYVFDATGNTNCSGTPKICNPLWTAPTGAGVFSSPAVANGVVFVGSLDHKLYAFDAAGIAGCSGTPDICNPLWSATTGARIFSSPAVVNGIVYVGSSDYNLYAFGLP